MVRTGLLTMSHGEIDRLSVIQRLLERRLNQKQASDQLGITPRQLRRLVNRYRPDGAAGGFVRNPEIDQSVLAMCIL